MMNYFFMNLNVFLNLSMSIFLGGMLFFTFFYFNMHPLKLMLILILYCIIMALKLNNLYSNYWYSYMLYLVMVGGLLILFMYFSSIIMNELFFFEYKLVYIYSMKIFLFGGLLSGLIIMMNYICNFFIIDSFFMMNLFIESNYMMKNLYSIISLDVMLFMFLYLLLTMIICVMICKKYMIPLRQMNI